MRRYASKLDSLSAAHAAEMLCGVDEAFSSSHQSVMRSLEQTVLKSDASRDPSSFAHMLKVLAEADKVDLVSQVRRNALTLPLSEVHINDANLILNALARSKIRDDRVISSVIHVLYLQIESLDQSLRKPALWTIPGVKVQRLSFKQVFQSLVELEGLGVSEYALESKILRTASDLVHANSSAAVDVLSSIAFCPEFDKKSEMHRQILSAFVAHVSSFSLHDLSQCLRFLSSEIMEPQELELVFQRVEKLLQSRQNLLTSSSILANLFLGVCYLKGANQSLIESLACKLIKEQSLRRIPEVTFVEVYRKAVEYQCENLIAECKKAVLSRARRFQEDSTIPREAPELTSSAQIVPNQELPTHFSFLSWLAEIIQRPLSNILKKKT
jgi:hypothetical protein